MGHLSLAAELRDGNTIRAYLDELVLRKAPVQFWIAQTDAPPFETTLARVARDTFSTAHTPPLPKDQPLNMAFTVDSRRFTARTQVVSSGIFKIPASVANGERRERFRAEFSRTDEIEVFACEKVSAPFIWGRVIAGKLIDLSLGGLRVALDDFQDLQGPPSSLKRGDSFASVCISGLPYTPTIQCAGTVTHLRQTPEGASASFRLTGLTESDLKNIERILARRFPTTFGQAFPRKHLKTDIADRPGAPEPTRATIKAAEVVAMPSAPPPAPVESRNQPRLTAVMRIRKAFRRILVISAGNDPDQTLAEQLKADDFKQVYEARSFLEAQALARASRFDLVLLDVKVGGHFGQMIMEALRRHDLLLNTPVILVADRRDAHIEAVALALEAIYIHEKRAPYSDLLPALHGLLM